MIVQALSPVVHMLINAFELPYYFAEIAVTHLGGVASVKHFRHINAVKPNLIGINFLVPEIAVLGARLSFDLGIQKLDCFEIFFLARFPVQVEKYSALVEVVQIVRFQLISAYRAVFEYVVIYKFIDKIKILFIAAELVNAVQRRHHTAVDIVPGRRFAKPYIFYVPNRSFGLGFAYQPVYVLFYYFVFHYFPREKVRLPSASRNFFLLYFHPLRLRT